jgi:hypothetical protein
VSEERVEVVRRGRIQITVKGSSLATSLSLTSCGVSGWLYGRSVSLKKETSYLAGSRALNLGSEMPW